MDTLLIFNEAVSHIQQHGKCIRNDEHMRAYRSGDYLIYNSKGRTGLIHEQETPDGYIPSELNVSIFNNIIEFHAGTARELKSAHILILSNKHEA